MLSLINPFKPFVKLENEDVVGAVPTGYAPTTSEWWTILLPINVWFILEVWRCVFVRIEYVYNLCIVTCLNRVP